MGAVSNILDYRECVDAPTLVLVDLHEDPPAPDSGLGRQAFLRALDNCRAALRYARLHSMPIAFVRQISPSPSFLATRPYPSWLGDITPRRSDMVFERALPSCYASAEFAQMARRSRELVVAGLFGETSCLATLMEGYSRAQAFTYLADASVSHSRNGLSADEIHRGVVGIASVYSSISSTDAWMDRMSRKFGTA